MHSAGLELTELTYTRLEGNLIRHRGDHNDHQGWLVIYHFSRKYQDLFVLVLSIKRLSHYCCI